MSTGPRSFAIAAILAAGVAWLAPDTQTELSVAANTGVITGVVRSDDGPEAGVWVIAETDDLHTTFRKIVVTDDEGRYLLPELPPAAYDVWVRGYGLVDSDPVPCYARPRAPPKSNGGADPTGRSTGLSVQLLALSDRAAECERVSRHWSHG